MELTPLISVLVFSLFLFAFWACWGSFLNVIVYRMPRNKPVSGGRSFCPLCETQILWQDNLPIIGWLRLKGMSRCCQQPISSRYPVVEALVAVGGLILFLVVITTHGMTLPETFSEEHHHNWLVEFPMCQLWPTMFLQGATFYLMLAMVLIQRDRFPVPAKLMGLTGVVLLIAGGLIFGFELPWLAFVQFDQLTPEKRQSLTILSLGLSMMLVFANRFTPQRDYALSSMAAVTLFLLGPVGLGVVVVASTALHWGSVLLAAITKAKWLVINQSSLVLLLCYVLCLLWQPVMDLLFAQV